MHRVVATDQVRGGAADTLARGHVLQRVDHRELLRQAQVIVAAEVQQPAAVHFAAHAVAAGDGAPHARSEEHTSELQSLMRISYAVFCLKKKKNTNTI